MSARREGVLAVLALSIAACSAVSNATVAEPSSTVDEAVFRCNVEPILARQCSYSACHGTALAALRVYSPGKLRETPAPDIDAAGSALTTDEHHENFLSASGFGYGLTSVDDDFLLRKPLPAAAGGFEHFGGAIFSGTDDPQYVAIRGWLTGDGACK